MLSTILEDECVRINTDVAQVAKAVEDTGDVRLRWLRLTRI